MNASDKAREQLREMFPPEDYPVLATTDFDAVLEGLNPGFDTLVEIFDSLPEGAEFFEASVGFAQEVAFQGHFLCRAGSFCADGIKDTAQVVGTRCPGCGHASLGEW